MNHMTRGLAGVLVLLAGCRGDPADQLPDDPDELTLFSIDGAGTWKGPTTGQHLHEGPVLGRVEVADPGRRREVVAAVKESIRTAPEVPKGCFMPRHVVRVAKAGRTVDVVICFECDNYRLRRVGADASSSGGGRLSSAGRPVLDKVLTDAGVPIAPK